MAKRDAAHIKPSAIEKLAQWVMAPRAEDIPASAMRQAKLLLLDTIGCGYAALDEVGSKAVLATHAELGGVPTCSVIGSAHKTNAPNAVLVNGALIRILDLNDYVYDMNGEIGGHPSDNIPVALAAGEASHASGREVIAAIVLGYEIFGRAKALMARDSAWDGVTGSGLVAPAMAARLMGLEVMQVANALALSAARSPTPLAVRHGAISAAKSFANALVAQNGMQAALLARYGVTGPLDLFDNPLGLASVFSQGEPVTTLTAPLPAEGYIMRASIKAYPCLATGQAIVAAGIALHEKINGAVEQLQQVRVAMPDMPFLLRQKDDPNRINPASREAADHSFNFLAAVSLIDGDLGLAQFDNERWNDPKVRAVMAKLEIELVPELNLRSPGGFPCEMRACDVTGREIVVEVPDPPGFSRRGLDDAAVIRKFNAITASHLDAASRLRIIEAALGLDGNSSCAQLTQALTQAEAP